MNSEEVERRKKTITASQTDVQRWSDSRQLESAWEARSTYAASFIPAGSTVLDVGCGTMSLEPRLPFGCRYLPLDVVRRDERTIVVDLNVAPIPEGALAESDLAVMLGTIEYLFRPADVLSRIAAAGRSILCSYCPTETTTHLDRRALGWVNDFSIGDFTQLAISCGYRVVAVSQIDEIQRLFRLSIDAVPPRSMRRKKVHVVSFNQVGNFGDRLGYHLLNQVLPPYAEVSWGALHPFSPVPPDIDLLVVGIGNSIFSDVLSDDLIAAVKAAKVSIGVFGTQYRERINSSRLQVLLDHITHWYARYDEDLYLYGRDRTNASHLGDWLVDAFPLAAATDDRVLSIGSEIWQQLPLDRVIQQIQRHKRVFSERVHPLLCALTSAEEVAYKEQPYPNAPSCVSGKFRSMLIDVFGRTYPEHQFWAVDRERIARYKAIVRENVESMRANIHRILQPLA